MFRLFALSLLLSSCMATYYPNTVHTPLFKQGKEANVAISALAQENLMLNAQGSYAITDKLAVMAGGAVMLPNIMGSYEKHWFAEAGVGTFKNVEEFILEGFVGYGRGHTQTENLDSWSSSSSELVKVDYHRIFVQPSIGIRSDIADASFATRLSYLYYSRYLIDQQPQGTMHHLFFEPVLTGRIGYRQVKFVMQLGLSLPMHSLDEEEWSPLIFSVGVHGNFRKFEESKTKTPNDL